MAITKETEVFKIDTTAGWSISIRTDTVIKEDGNEISRTPHRHALVPFKATLDAEHNWVYEATDLSGEDQSVKDVAAAVWTEKVKEDYKTMLESNTKIGN